jgi:release factor glutamine methyltransferase
MEGDTDIHSLRAKLRVILSGSIQQVMEIDWIICHIIGTERSLLHSHPELKVSVGDAAAAAALAMRRAAGEPMAYLTGSAIFCGREFKVDKRVLIPRPETEILTAIAGERVKRIGHGGVLADWCTGSGCIVMTLLGGNPLWRAFAADSSLDALRVAEENAGRMGVLDRVTLFGCSDPKEAAGVIPGESLDFVVANPPYIPAGEIPELEAQVRDYEPVMALDGGPGGLDVIRLLMRGLPRFMKGGAELLIETGGVDQVEILSRPGEGTDDLELARVFEDHCGIERFMLWIKS